MLDFVFLRPILFISILIYFIFEHFDSKQVKDEREELIRLKTNELVHRVTTLTVSAFALLYFFFPWMNALYPILAIIFSFLYTEIIGKIYFRRKI